MMKVEHSSETDSLAYEEWAKEHGILTEDYKRQLNERRKSAEDTYSAQAASLQRLALYDEEYAKQNGLTTQKLNDNAWMVKDSMSGLTTTFFDNEEALKQELFLHSHIQKKQQRML